MQEVRDQSSKAGKPRRGWGPPIAGLIVAVTALSLDTVSPLTRRLPIHWVPVLGVASGLVLACWPLAWRLARRGRRANWIAAGLALLPLASLGAYLLWTPPLLSVVSVPPMAFSSGEQRHLVYEMRIKHYGFRHLLVRQVRVLGDDGQLLRTFEAGGLLEASQSNPQGTAALTLPAGRDTTLFLWLDVQAGQPLPDRLHHQLVLDASARPPSQGLGRGEVVPAASTRRRRRPRLPVMAAPLGGGPWLARFGPSNDSPQRRARALGHISQRFAIDWVMLNSQGGSLRPGRQAVDNRSPRNEDFLAWGRPVLAAFSGTVSAVRDGAPDYPPETSRPPVNLSNFAGNYVVVRSDDRYCAFYGHLQSGSITVQPGERIFARRVLGKIGNSGDSEEPHLHFQIADDCDWLRSEGLPYHLESFRSHGFLAGSNARAIAPPGPYLQYALPLLDQIVTFPER